MNTDESGCDRVPEPPTRVFVVDDSPAITQAIRSILEEIPEVELIGTANSAPGAIDSISQLHPHLVLLDIRMPEMNGLEVTRRLRDEFPELLIIIVTGLDGEIQHVCERAGANGFVLKRRLDRDLPNEIRRVMSQCQMARMEGH